MTTPLNCLVFDVETVPDVELGRRLYDLHDLDDAAVAHAMFAKQRAARQNDFLPPAQQRIVAISVLLRSRDGLRIFSLGDEQAPERELVQRFFDGLERFTPTLVSWNGSGFDLPVLHYRELRHGVSAHRYWELGDSDREFRYNNYLSRYHWRHIDLMDVLSGYGASGRASLELASQLVGLPGKLGIGGANDQHTDRDGRIAEIRDYCEVDTVNTYLLYLRFQKLRGALADAQYAKECALLRGALEKLKAPHWREFLARWSG